MSIEHVILVDPNDQEIGLMEKMEAHEKGLLHRAFSVFIFNDKNEFLLHQRADSKYHSGGLWTNTCCSHPKSGENIIDAGKRRLIEEMGFSAELKSVHSFIYKAKLDNNLTEHEYDHILIGHFNNKPEPNPLEVKNWKWMKYNEISTDLKNNPNNYTFWFKIAFAKLVEQNLINF